MKWLPDMDSNHDKQIQSRWKSKFNRCITASYRDVCIVWHVCGTA